MDGDVHAPYPGGDGACGFLDGHPVFWMGDRWGIRVLCGACGWLAAALCLFSAGGACWIRDERGRWMGCGGDGRGSRAIPPLPPWKNEFPMRLWKRVTLRTLFRVACGHSPCHSVAPCDVVEVGGWNSAGFPATSMDAGQLGGGAGVDRQPDDDGWDDASGCGGIQGEVVRGEQVGGKLAR